jgi:hypothetical protein
MKSHTVFILLYTPFLLFSGMAVFIEGVLNGLVFRFKDMLPQDAVKQFQVKGLGDVVVKAEPAVFLVNIVIAAAGDHRQVGIYCLDALEHLQAAVTG